MNKQLTKKTIGIAASAALMASMAFSGSALAGHNDNHNSNKQGPQQSLDVFTVCEIDQYNDEIDIRIELTDKSSGEAVAALGNVTVLGKEKNTGQKWYDSGFAWDSDFDTCQDEYGNDIGPIEIGKVCHVSLPVNCATLDNNKALNAETTVVLDETDFAASKDAYMSRCKDDPDTYENEAIMKIADYPYLCK